MTTEGPVYGLVLEYRLQHSPDNVQVQQLVCFDSCVYGRTIDTDHPRRHWIHYEIVQKRDEKPLDERLPLMTAWITESCRQFEGNGFTLTSEPFLVQATWEEFQTEILKGDFPRNVPLRIERVRKEDDRPDPLEATSA